MDETIYPPGESPPPPGTTFDSAAKPKKSILKSSGKSAPSAPVSGTHSRKSHVPFSHILPELSQLEEEDARAAGAGRDADLQSVSSAASLSPLSSGDEMATGDARTAKASRAAGRAMRDARPGPPPPRRGGFRGRPPAHMMGFGPGPGHHGLPSLMDDMPPGVVPPMGRPMHPMDRPPMDYPMDRPPLDYPMDHPMHLRDRSESPPMGRRRLSPGDRHLLMRSSVSLSPVRPRLVRYTPSPERRRVSRSPGRRVSRSPGRRGSRSPLRRRSRSRSPRRFRSRSRSRSRSRTRPRRTRSPSPRRRSSRRSRSRSRSPSYRRSSVDPSLSLAAMAAPVPAPSALGVPQPAPMAGFPQGPAPVPSPYSLPPPVGPPVAVPTPGLSAGLTPFPTATQSMYPQPVATPGYTAVAPPVAAPSPAPSLLSVTSSQPSDGITERLDSATFMMEVAKRREQKILEAKLGIPYCSASAAAAPSSAGGAPVAAAAPTPTPAPAAPAAAAASGASNTAAAGASAAQKSDEEVPAKFFSKMTPEEQEKKAAHDLEEVKKIKPWFTMELIKIKMQMDEHRLTQGIKNKEFRVMAKKWNTLVLEAKKKNDMKTALSGEASEGAVERLARRLEFAIAHRDKLAGEMLQLKADQKRYGKDIIWKRKEGGPVRNKRLHENLKRQGEMVDELDKATDMVAQLTALLYPADKDEQRQAMRGPPAKLLETAEQEAELDAATKAGELVHFLILGDETVDTLQRYVKKTSRDQFGSDLPATAIQLRWRGDASLHSLQMRHWIRSQVNHVEPQTLLLLVSAQCLQGNHWFPAMAVSPLFSLLRDLKEAGLERAIIVGCPPQRRREDDERVTRLNKELQQRFVEDSPKMPMLDYVPFMAGPLDGFGKRTPEDNTRDMYKTIKGAIAKCKQQEYGVDGAVVQASSKPAAKVHSSEEAASVLKQLKSSLMGRLASEEAARLSAVVDLLKKKEAKQKEEQEPPLKEERKVSVKKAAEPERKSEVEVNPDAEDPTVFFKDPADHLCLLCNKIFINAKSYLDHIKSDEHSANYAKAQPEAPWRKALPAVEKKTAKAVPKPIKGLDMFIRVDCFYCKVCDCFVGDLRCASSHLKSRRHNTNYDEFLENNPGYHAVISENRTRLLLQIAAEERERTRKRRLEEQERYANTQNEKLRKISESTVVQDVTDTTEAVKKEATTPPVVKKAGGIKLNLINPPAQKPKEDDPKVLQVKKEVEELKKKVAAALAEEKVRAEKEAKEKEEAERIRRKKLKEEEARKEQEEIERLASVIPAVETKPEVKQEVNAEKPKTTPAAGSQKQVTAAGQQKKMQPIIGKLPHLRIMKKQQETAANEATAAQTVTPAVEKIAEATIPPSTGLTLEERAKLEYAMAEGLLTEQEKVTLQLALLQDSQADMDISDSENDPPPPGLGPGAPGVAVLPPTKPGVAPPMSHTPPPAPRNPPPRLTGPAQPPARSAGTPPPGVSAPPAAMQQTPPPMVPRPPPQPGGVAQPLPPGLTQPIVSAPVKPPPLPHAPPPAPRAPPPTTSSPAVASKPSAPPPLPHAPPPAPKAPPPTSSIQNGASLPQPAAVKKPAINPAPPVAGPPGLEPEVPGTIAGKSTVATSSQPAAKPSGPVKSTLPQYSQPTATRCTLREIPTTDTSAAKSPASTKPAAVSLAKAAANNPATAAVAVKSAAGATKQASPAVTTQGSGSTSKSTAPAQTSKAAVASKPAAAQTGKTAAVKPASAQSPAAKTTPAARASVQSAKPASPQVAAKLTTSQQTPKTLSQAAKPTTPQTTTARTPVIPSTSQTTKPASTLTNQKATPIAKQVTPQTPTASTPATTAKTSQYPEIKPCSVRLATAAIPKSILATLAKPSSDVKPTLGDKAGSGASKSLAAAALNDKAGASKTGASQSKPTNTGSDTAVQGKKPAATKPPPKSLLPAGTEAVSDDEEEDEISVMDEDLLEYDLPDAGDPLK